MVVEKSAPEQIQETHACTDLYFHFWSSVSMPVPVSLCMCVCLCILWVFTSSYVSNTLDVLFLLFCYCIFVFDGSVFISFTAKISPNVDCIFLFAVSVSVQTLVDARFFFCWFLSLLSFFHTLDKCRQRTWVRAQNVIRYLLWKPLQKKCWFFPSLSKFRQKRNRISEMKKERKKIDNKFESRWRQKDHSNEGRKGVSILYQSEKKREAGKNPERLIETLRALKQLQINMRKNKWTTSWFYIKFSLLHA